jgi:colanic acid biosynthesis glycosyl transferase WcaI
VYSGPEGDVKELIMKSKGGINVAEGDSKAISQTIINLYKHPEEVKQLGKNARHYIENNYNVKYLMQQFESIIGDVLKS